MMQVWPRLAEQARAGLPPLPSYRQGVQALLWAWFAAVLVFNLPGHLTTDSLIQIAEGRSRVVESWNPPFSSWLFGTLVEWGGGTEAILVLQSWMLALSLYSLVGCGEGSGRRWAWVPLAALLVTPVWITYPGIVWKDVWFAHCSLGAFALVAVRARGSGWWAEALALLLLAAAMLSRQTGILVCLAALAALAAVAGPAAGVGPCPWWKLAWSWLWRLLLLLALGMVLNAWVKSHLKLKGDAVGTGFRLVAIFDMAGMLQREPQAQLELLRAQGFDTQAWEQGGRQTFSAERIDTLVQPPITGPRALDMGLMLGQWGKMVAEHPLTYLQHRWETFAWFNGLRDQGRCLPIHVGIEPAALAEKAGIRSTPAAWSGWLYAYSRHFVNTPYFAPIAWMAVSVLLVVFWAWRRQWQEPLLWAQVGGLLYWASYAMAGLSCDFRYSYFPVLAAGIGLVKVCAHGLSVSRSQHA